MDQQGRASPATARSNAAIARELWLAASESDAEAIRRLLHPDIRWRTFSSGSLSGAIQGVEAVIDLMARSGELTDELTTSLIDIYASDTGTVTHYRVDAARGAKAVEVEVLLVMHMHAGLVVEAFAVPMAGAEADRFWQSH